MQKDSSDTHVPYGDSVVVVVDVVVVLVVADVVDVGVVMGGVVVVLVVDGTPPGGQVLSEHPTSWKTPCIEGISDGSQQPQLTPPP